MIGTILDSPIGGSCKGGEVFGMSMAALHRPVTSCLACRDISSKPLEANGLDSKHPSGLHSLEMSALACHSKHC
jgi:hypothetical protein